MILLSRSVFVFALLFSLISQAEVPFAFWKPPTLTCTPGSYNPDVSLNGGYVRSIVTNGTITYIGGLFTQVQGQSRYNIAAINNQTGALLNFNPRVNNMVRSMQLSGSTLFVAGEFTASGSFLMSGGAIMTATGTPSLASPLVTGTVYVSVADNSGGWFIGGDFFSVGGIHQNSNRRSIHEHRRLGLSAGLRRDVFALAV